MSFMKATPASWLRLGNRVAIVTGAGGGIGATVSYQLALQGCHVVVADQHLNLAEETAHSCLQSQTKAKMFPIQCDVTQSMDVQRLIREADKFACSAMTSSDEGSGGNACDASSFSLDAPQASILVNCAGITRDARIQYMTEEDFDEVVNVNLRGTFLTCKYFATSERLDNLTSTSTLSSSLINISSIVGLRGNKGQANYAASKAGVIGMSKTLAKELAKYNVRVNAIVPGFIDTPMSAKLPERLQQSLKSNIPMKRFGTTQNVSDLILFLASERSAYITGEAVEISGAISF